MTEEGWTRQHDDVGTFTGQQFARALYVGHRTEDARAVLAKSPRTFVRDEVFVLDDQYAQPGEIGRNSWSQCHRLDPLGAVCRCGADPLLMPINVAPH